MHATALPLSLLILSQSRHCPRPIMPVLHCCVPRTFWRGRMLTHCPAVLNRTHCLGHSLVTLTLCFLGTRARLHARTHKHTQGLFCLLGAQGKGCLSDNRLRPFLTSSSKPPPFKARHTSLRTGCNRSVLLYVSIKRLIILLQNEEGANTSVHSRPSYGIPRENCAISGPATCNIDLLNEKMPESQNERPGLSPQRPTLCCARTDVHATFQTHHSQH